MAEFGIRRPSGCSLYEGGERRKRARNDSYLSEIFFTGETRGIGVHIQRLTSIPSVSSASAPLIP